MITCPCCAEKKRIYYKNHWDNKYKDFACGNCRLEMKLPVNMINPQFTINQLFYHDFIEDMENKVNAMTDTEKLARLKELESKKRDN